MATTSPTLTVRHRTIAGPLNSPITDLAHDTHVRTVTPVTITSARYHGTGSSLRATLGLRDDNGATLVAQIDADILPMIPDFLRRPGVRLNLGGLVRRFPAVPGLVGLTIRGVDVA